MISAILFSLAAFGTLAMAVKFGLGPVPSDYHRQIVERDGQVDKGTLRVLTTLSRGFGGALGALGLLVLFLAWTEVADGSVVTAAAITASGLVLAGPTTVLPRRVEQETGIRTPWRVGALSGAMLLAAFVAALF